MGELGSCLFEIRMFPETHNSEQSLRRDLLMEQCVCTCQIVLVIVLVYKVKQKENKTDGRVTGH